MQQRDRKRSLDACVKRGAECNTDHQLLRIKMKVTGKGEYHHLRTKKHKRFNVSQLTGRDETGRQLTGRQLTGRQLYRELVYRKTAEPWVNEGTVEENWSATKSVVVG